MTAYRSRLARITLSLALALVGTAAMAARTAPAQGVAALRGTYVWDSAASDDVAEAIDRALAGMSSLHRRFARGHLRAANQPYRTVTIEQDAATVGVAIDGGEPIRMPVSGEPITWTRPDGKRMRVSVVREDHAIRQTFEAGDEERENLFRPSADGQLMIMAVTVRMNRLSNPIRYQLVYRQ